MQVAGKFDAPACRKWMGKPRVEQAGHVEVPCALPGVTITWHTRLYLRYLRSHALSVSEGGGGGIPQPR